MFIVNEYFFRHEDFIYECPYDNPEGSCYSHLIGSDPSLAQPAPPLVTPRTAYHHLTGSSVTYLEDGRVAIFGGMDMNRSEILRFLVWL